MEGGTSYSRNRFSRKSARFSNLTVVALLVPVFGAEAGSKKPSCITHTRDSQWPPLTVESHVYAVEPKVRAYMDRAQELDVFKKEQKKPTIDTTP